MSKTFFIAATAAVLCSCSNQPKYIIEGNIDGLAGTVYLFQKDSLIDSAIVDAGKFRIKGAAGNPTVGFLSDSRDDQPQALAVQFILESGTISVKNDAEDPQIRHTTGTPANDAADAYSTSSRALSKEYRNENTTDERREAIEAEFENLSKTTIDANRNNLFGILLLQSTSHQLSGQEIMDEIAKFSTEIQQTNEVAYMKTMAEQKIKTDIGQPYIDIMQNNMEGQVVTLASVIANPANKFTLVDFWASWCSPCMGELPYLKQTYDKFHSKGFEIYGVSFDKEREKWIITVKDKNMNWIQVSDLNGFENPAAKDYAVQGIPANYLIDAQGKIVAKNLRGEELYTKIEELLGE